MIDLRLIKNLKRFSNAHEASEYLDFVGDLLTALELANDDLRFHFNPTGSSTSVLPLTINHRYIVAKGRDLDGKATWWLLTPPPGVLPNDLAAGVLDLFSFAHKRHDPPEGAAHLCRFEHAFIAANRAAISALTLAAARRDLLACRGSTPSRLSHSAQAYAAALDDATRTDLLNIVFQREG